MYFTLIKHLSACVNALSNTQTHLQAQIATHSVEKVQGFISTASPAKQHQRSSFKRTDSLSTACFLGLVRVRSISYLVCNSEICIVLQESERETPAVCLWHDTRPAHAAWPYGFTETSYIIQIYSVQHPFIHTAQKHTLIHQTELLSALNDTSKPFTFGSVLVRWLLMAFLPSVSLYCSYCRV